MPPSHYQAPAVLLVIVGSVGVAHAVRAQVEPVAFVGISVVPMDAERVLPGQTVIVREGRVTAMGPAEDLELTPGAVVIDGTGRFLIPGLADMHAHFTRPEELLLFVANGVTTVRLMWGWDRARAWRDSIAGGTLLGPALFVASGIFEGTPPPEFSDVIVTQGRIIVNSRAEARWQTAWQASRGYDFIKVYNNLNREAYEGIVDEARERGLTVAGHVPFDVGLKGVLQAGQRSIEHLRGYIFESVPPGAPQQPGRDLRSRDLAWRFADTTRFSVLAEMTRNAGTWNVPTLAVRIFLRPQEVVEQYLARPEARYLPPAAQAALRDRGRIPWLSNYSAEDFQAASAGDAAKDALLRALHRAGARLLAGTDVGPLGFSLHWELELLVGAGLTPYDALVAATRDPAEFLGREDAGTIAVGKRADLVVLDGNPLDDIRNTRHIRGVVAGGRWFDRTVLDAMLERSVPQ